ncbi:MAG: leishmanolysin-related zinc metalloendopeptidase [Pirellulaceae bacterium]
MKNTRVLRSDLDSRPSTSRSTILGFEQLENRMLLSVDLWQATDAFFSNYVATNPVRQEESRHVREQSDSTAQATLRVGIVGSSSSVDGAAVPPSATQRWAASQWATAEDDVFENNDNWYHAANLGTIRQPESIIDLVMADRVDWYRMNLDRSADASAAVSIQFQYALGDLDLAVYDAGGRLVSFSNGITNSETTSLAGARPGTYYVFVYGYGGATNPHYTLSINPGQSVVDDRFEPNNSFAQAANLGTLTAPYTESNLVMADTADWYRFTMDGPGTVSDYVGIEFQHTGGDLDVAVYDANGRRVGFSNGVADSERISLDGLSEGTYYVHVYGYLGATNSNYSLIVDPGIPAPDPAPSPTSSAFHIDMNLRGLTASQELVFRDAAARWQQIILGDLPNAVYNGRTVDDVLIDASTSYFDGPGGVLGGTAPDRFRPETLLPYHGTMQFDTSDLAQLEANGTLRDVVLHEIGHVLGIGTIWQSRGLLSGANTNDPRFLGTQATVEYNALCQCDATSVPVANTGGAGTRNGHWREAVFTSELMTGYIGPGLNLPLSRITVASLADLGYQVDLSMADRYRLG